MLTKLTLKNFKSFKDAELSLGPLTILVGANASGKSNLRDAFRFLHGIGRGYSLAEILGEKWGPGGVLQWRGIRGGVKEAAYYGSKSFGIEALVREPAVAQQTWNRHSCYGIDIAVANSQLGPLVEREFLYADPTRRTDYDLVFDSHFPADPARKPDEAHSISVRLSREERLGPAPSVKFPNSRAVLSQIPGLPLDHLDIGAYERAQVLRITTPLRAMRFLDLDPDAMRQPSMPGQTILGDRGENLSSAMQALIEDSVRKEILLEWVRLLTPLDVVGFEFPADYTGRILVHLVEKSGHKISAYSASDGTLRFLAMITALLSSDSGQFYFFEELDNGLHPTRLHLLLNLIQQACRDYGVQVVGTTHNPFLLTFLQDDAWKDASLIYRREGEAASGIMSFRDLPDIQRILQKQDLGRLHASGWFENVVEFIADPEMNEHEDDDENDPESDEEENV